LLCAGLVRFVLRHDRDARFHFATAQSDLGQSLYASLGLPTEAFETNLVIVDGVIHTHAQGFGAVMAALGGVWSPLGAIRRLPRWSTDWAYGLIARNRYRLFGRTDTCPTPSPALRARLLA
jgi:predicted DCC family thiol-disulfide oxidoreductase YuxK